MSGRGGFCNDCAHACTERCQRVTPDRHVRWNAFERVGLAGQYDQRVRRYAAYTSWISREWATWRALVGLTSGFLGSKEHAAFDRWLAERHDVPAPHHCEAA